MIDQPTIDRILDAAQIVDVVSEFVTLKKRGVNYIGLCPFHADKSPSFYVSPAKGLCKCFACGKGGSAVHFIMEHEQLNYGEALRWLAKKYHIEVSDKPLNREERQAQSARESMYIVNEFAKNYFSQTLHQHTDGRTIGLSYFRNRGISDEIIRKFHLGFCVDRNDAFYREAQRGGYRKEYLLKTGLCFVREDGSVFDRFRGRVIFPWFNVSGRVVGFGGRVLDSRTKGVQQKYVNSPDSEIYSKRRELYGIYQGKSAIVKADRVYMVEGYTDVIAMHQCGLENVVANSGTALSAEQVRILHRFTSNVTFLYDGDEAGIKASIRGIDMLLSEGMNVKVLILPDGDDPDSFARKHTAEEMRTYISDHEENFIRFKARLLLKDTEGDPSKLAELIADMAHSIGLIPNEVVRYACLKECASILNVDEQIVLNEIKKVVLQRRDGYVAEKLSNHSSESLDNISKPLDNISKSLDNISKPLDNVSKSLDNISKSLEKDVENKREEDLLRALVRYGERVVCHAEGENGEEIPISVADYISMDLEQDGLSFRNPLHQAMLHSVLLRLDDEGFSAERFLLSHPDTAVSQLAAELLSDRHQLSKFNEQAITKDEERLHELVPRLLMDFKRSVVDDELKGIMAELQHPEVLASPKRAMEIMKRYKELSDTARELAKRCGERVIVG